MFADRLAPACARLAFARRSRPAPEPSEVRSVLIWNVDSLGDFLWTTPVQRAIRDGYPQAEITLVCNKACASLVEHSPHLDRIVAVDPKPFYGYRAFFRTIPELRGRRFDVMVVLEMGSRPADAGRLIGRRLNVGLLASTNLGHFKTMPDHILPPNSSDAPEYWPKHFLRIVEFLGLPTVPPRLEVATTDEDAAVAWDALGDSTRNGSASLIGFHPCVAPYANQTKKWPNSRFVELAVEISKRRPARFVLTGSSAERGECGSLARQIRQASGAECVCTAGQLNPRQTVALLKTLQAFVVADTAALHMAVAAGTPTVALFGATDDRRIAPDTPNCIVLKRDLPCSPCHAYSDRLRPWVCVFDHNKCMHLISAAEVEEAVHRLLDMAVPAAPSFHRLS